MLYVFIVSSGTMMKFDMNLAVKKVTELKKEIFKKAKIPEDVQVLLCSGGEELQSDNIVGNYYGAGTDTNPIFLFSKHPNEMDHYSGNLKTSMSLNIEDDVKGCQTMSPSASAAMVRLSLAQHFAESAVNGRRECEELVHSQHLQQQGWAAVIANLEDAKDTLQKRSIHFEELFQKYLTNRSSYQETIYKFPEDIELLARIPLLPKLMIENDCTAEDLSKKHTLLSWFISEPQDVLETLVEKCHHLLDELNEHAIIALNEEFQRVLKTVDNPDIKEVKGIEERLTILNRKVDEARQLEKDQLDLAAWFNQYQVQGYISNDLPALCETFQKQLEIMLNNHKCLRTILDQCTKAKMELSDSINARLKYISKVESEMYQLHMRILLLESHVQSIVSQVETYRQVQVAPLRYLKLLAEVCRRKAFSENYMKWATELSSQVSKLYHKEIDIRKSFSSVENMVDNLFPGMNDVPPPFAVDCPPPFDQYLPDITKEDLELLKLRFPELSHFCEVVPPDPMPYISQAESDSAFSSNVPSSRVASDYVGAPEKIPSVKEEPPSDKLAVPSTEYSSLPSEYASLPNEVFSLTSSPFEDPLLPSHMQEQHNKTLQYSAKSASKDQVDSEGEEFETVDYCRTSPVAISSHSTHVTRARPTSSSDMIDVSVHQKHYSRVSKSRSDGDAVSPMQEFLKSPDSLPISSDFQAAEYYIDDSMPSSYTESNATSPLLRGNRMVKSHHVVVAELQRQVEEKNGALTVTKNSLENSHSNIMKLHAKISALQKFIQELQGNLKSDLSDFKAFVAEKHCAQVAEMSEVIEHINSYIGKMEQQMQLEKEAAVTEAKAQFSAIERELLERFEIENHKLVDAENQIAYYEENLRSTYLSYEETKHEKELLESELLEKKELIQRMMLEHELEFDAFKNETREILVEKETEITQLKQDLSEALLKAKKSEEDKSSIEEESQKQLSLVTAIQEQKKLLEQELEKLQEEREKVQDLKEAERKLELALEEKARTVKALEETCKNLTKYKEDIERVKETELKELEEKLSIKHKNDLESLRSRFRLAVSMTSLEKPPSLSETPDAESLTYIEDVKKIIAEDREKWESGKLKALEEEHQKELNILKDSAKEINLKHEEEKTKLVEGMKRKHENALEKLKSRMTAENQVTFNEAVATLAKEKDSVIENLRSQISDLETKQLAIKTYLGQLQLIPHSSSGEDVMSQSEFGASSSVRGLQSTSEHNMSLKIKTDIEALLQITDATNIPYQLASASSSSNTSEQAAGYSNVVSIRKPCAHCPNRISILTCEPGDLVLVWYDEKLEHFIIFHFGNHIHFLHSESVAALDLKIPAGPSEKWTIGVVAYKEFCVTKKVNNRFKLNLGTRFYRVKVNKWSHPYLAQQRNVLSPSVSLSTNQSKEQSPSEDGDRARTSSGMSASSI